MRGYILGLSLTVMCKSDLYLEVTFHVVFEEMDAEKFTGNAGNNVLYYVVIGFESHWPPQLINVVFVLFQVCILF